MLKRNLFVISLNRYHLSSSAAASLKSKVDHGNKQVDGKLSTKNRKNHLYRNLFEWNSHQDLAKILMKNVVFNDYGLIAISKPWGLGIHKSNIEYDLKNQSKVEQLLNSKIIGEPKYSVADCTDLLAQLMNINRRLHIVKSPDRRWSGIVLLSEDKLMENLIRKSLQHAKANLIPPLRFYCIVNGMIPNAVIGNWYQERCGIRLTEIDELGTTKESIYVSPNEMTKNIRKTGAHKNNRYQLGPVKSATIKYRVLAQNPELSVSLIDLHTTTTKWSTIQCFLAYKTSFILGDTLFSYRVKHLFGQKITMSTLKQINVKNWRHIDQSFEPLSNQVCNRLSVRSNREIPLMIHHYGILLSKLKRSLRNRKKQNDQIIEDDDDLIIETTNVNHLPQHFIQTLDRLNLNIFSQN